MPKKTSGLTVRRLIEFLQHCEPEAPIDVVGTGLLVDAKEHRSQFEAAGVMLSAARATNELTIGVGETVLGEGKIDGRPVVILRPVLPGATSQTTPHIFDASLNYVPQPDDTILWIDGHPDMLIRALVSAAIHHLPKDPV